MSEQTEFPSHTHRIKTGCGNMYVHLLYKDENRTTICRVSVTFGKAGGCACTQLQSKAAFINALIKNTPHGVAISTLTAARGHRCYAGDTCHDLLIQLVVEELMKIKI